MSSTDPLADPVADLLSFLACSPSPYHAVASVRARLEAAGFVEISLREPWADAALGKRFCVRSGAIIAWDATDRDLAADGFRIIGAHTDSPNLRVKPKADVVANGYREIAVEIYGGALANSWLDRDLGFSGRLVRSDGSVELVHVDRPVARVAQLAIHLDREVNDKGLQLDRQLHLLPLSGLAVADDPGFIALAARSAGIEPAEVVSFDLMFHDVAAPALLGVDDEFIASARLDNLFSCWAATQALTKDSDVVTRPVAVIALFDHEEVGSDSTTGAAGPLLESVLQRLCTAAGAGVDATARAFAGSACLSSDMAHALHPNYPDRHEPGHRPVLNSGPVLKVNSSQRYATDARSAQLFSDACRRAEVSMQFYVSHNSVPCGSTIGPVAATRLGIDTVDVGCAMLSMHSARELCGARDAEPYVRVLGAFLRPD